MKTNFSKIKKGFVMLYAVLLVSIVLVISLSLFDINYRQLILASTIEASQVAFYAADSTRDCVLHWDQFWLGDYSKFNDNHFGFIENNPPPAQNNFYIPNDAVPIECFSNDPLFPGDGAIGSPGYFFGSGGVGGLGISSLSFDLSNGNNSACSAALITKDSNPVDPNPVKEKFEISGYNLCDANGVPDRNNLRGLERSILVK